MPLFRAALQAGTHHLDMPMSLSYPIPASRTALVGMGVEPRLSDVFARYAADELFRAVRPAPLLVLLRSKNFAVTGDP